MIPYHTYHSLSATHPGIQDALRLAFDARGSLPARQTLRTQSTDQSRRCLVGPSAAPAGWETRIGMKYLHSPIRSDVKPACTSPRSAPLRCDRGYPWHPRTPTRDSQCQHGGIQYSLHRIARL